LISFRKNIGSVNTYTHTHIHIHTYNIIISRSARYQGIYEFFLFRWMWNVNQHIYNRRTIVRSELSQELMLKGSRRIKGSSLTGARRKETWYFRNSREDRISCEKRKVAGRRETGRTNQGFLALSRGARTRFLLGDYDDDDDDDDEHGWKQRIKRDEWIPISPYGDPARVSVMKSFIIRSTDINRCQPRGRELPNDRTKSLRREK